MTVQAGTQKGPEGWLVRIRAQGPGARRPRKDRRPGVDKRTGHRGGRDLDRAVARTLDAETRKQVAAALKSIIQTYPFGLVAASIGPQDVDMVLRCPASDLALIADLVKRRLAPTLRQAGFGGRFWRKGFLRRALGTEGQMRHALGVLRRDARMHHFELIETRLPA
jgi:REP element-mobilizing transposase RayT